MISNLAPANKIELFMYKKWEYLIKTKQTWTVTAPDVL